MIKPSTTNQNIKIKKVDPAKIKLTNFTELEILLKLREYQNKRKELFEENMICIGDNNWYSYNEKIMFTNVCKDGNPLSYWSMYIEEVFVNKFILIPFDLREVAKKYLKIDIEDKVNSKNLFENLIILLGRILIEKNNHISIRQIVSSNKEFETEIDISLIPINGSEEREFRHKIENQIKLPLLEYLKQHKPCFEHFTPTKNNNCWEDDENPYFLKWGELLGSAYSLKYEPYKTTLMYLENENLNLVGEKDLEYVGNYDDELFEWIKWEFFNEENPDSFDDLLKAIDVLKKFKTKKGSLNEK